MLSSLPLYCPALGMLRSEREQIDEAPESFGPVQQSEIIFSEVT